MHSPCIALRPSPSSFSHSTPRRASRAGDPQDTRCSLLCFSLPRSTCPTRASSAEGQDWAREGPGLHCSPTSSVMEGACTMNSL